MSEAVVSHALVTAADAPPPTRFALFLHGIFGSGGNWRSFARRLVTLHPSWGVVLVDLRNHGQSQTGFAPPHSLEAAARDLLALDAVLPGVVDAVVGHSFGGKVALAYVAARRGDLSLAWSLDASPGPRPDARGSEVTLRALDLMDRTAGRDIARDVFMAGAVDAGFTPALAQWLAMNLRLDAGSGGHRLRVDPRAIRTMLEDYFAQDLWSVVESPPGRVLEHLVVGGRSDVYDRDDRARLERAVATSHGRVAMHVLPEAGHWVHVDDPDGLFDAMAPSFEA